MRTPRLSRFHGFLLASGVLIGTVVVVSGLLVGWFFERHVREHEGRQILNLVQTEALEHLTSTYFLAGRPIPRGVAELFLRELTGVFRVKIYDKTGRIIWSNEPRLIGTTVRDEPSLAKALKGEATAILGAPTGSEHVYERTAAYVTEAYVPISFPESPGIVGVIEAYQDVTDIVVGVHRTQRQIWGVAGGMGLFLFVALALVTWAASVKEQRAHAALLVKREEIERANQALQEAQAQLVEKERLAAAGQVVVGLHHAILNPLAGSLGALQVLKQREIAPVVKVEAVAQAEAEVRQIEEVVRRLAALRRVTAAAYVGNTTMLDLERSSAEGERV